MAILDQLITANYAIYNGDSIEVMQSLPTASIHLSVYSPPFGGMLYQYSSDPADLSNSKDYTEFFDHYDFVVSEINRLTMPGRMTAVHCQDIAITRGEYHHLIDFPGDIIHSHVRCRNKTCKASALDRARGLCGHGWFKQVAAYSVWKEPLMVRNRTMVKSLHHKTMCEDSSKCSIANADKLLVFRRPGDNAVPIAHPTGLTYYAGSKEVPNAVLKFRGYTGNQIKNEYSQWVWRQYASAFWDDIRIDRVLPYRMAKDECDEKHVHPLQLDVIERCMALWSNPGDTVLTPFMGVGSEVYGAVINGRRALGIELKPSYYRQAIRNLQEAKPHQPEETALFNTTEDLV